MAEEVLQLDALDHGTRAIKSLCRAELVDIAQLGMFKKATTSPRGSLLWCMLTMVSRLMYAETQAVEGLNSIIKLMGRRSPNISLELLSSRLTIKHMLGQATGVTGCGKKFSAIKAVAEKEITELSDFAIPSMAVLADAARWAPVLALQFPGPDAPAIQDVSATAPAATPARETTVHNNPVLPICDMLERGLIPSSNAFVTGPAAKLWGEAVEWARSYNLGLKWTTGGGKQKKLSAAQAAKIKLRHTADGLGILIVPSIDMTETDLYVVTDRFSHSVCFSRLKTFKRATDSGEVCDCVRWQHDGSNFADSIESTLLFGRYFHVCKQHSISVRSAFLSFDMCRELFTSPGYLLTKRVVDASVELFVMTAGLMKGAQAPKKKKVNAKAKAKAKTAKESSAQGALEETQHANFEDADCGKIGETDGEGDYMDDKGMVDGMQDVSDGEDEDSNAAYSEDNRDNDMAAAHNDREVEQVILKKSDCAPTAREVAHVADAVSGACVSQTPVEIQEEALLLLIRQRNQAGQNSSSSSSLRLEGVGDGDMAGVATSDQGGLQGASAESASDIDDQCAPENTGFLDAATRSDKRPSSHMSTLHCWALSCVKRLQAFQDVARLQQDNDIGEHRSISLVLMHTGKQTNCSCVRCRWGVTASGEPAADLPELLWVTWLDNHPAHGLASRRARHVNLDRDSKILYCTADVTYARTGLPGGLGHPEILCDSNHAQVIIGFVGAAMKKVRKTNPDRDEVPACCLSVRAFYEMMIYRLSGMDAAAEEQIVKLSCVDVCYSTQPPVACPSHSTCLVWSV